MDDLSPSGSDKSRSTVGQTAPDFTISDTHGNSVNLTSELTGTTVKGVVLYFTMWCPTCDTHMSQMRDAIIPAFPDVVFFALDYVSGSVAEASIAEISNGYSGSGFRVLADIGHQVADSYTGTMGTTVVVDKTGVIRMNEDFKDGTRLYAALASLP